MLQAPMCNPLTTPKTCSPPTSRVAKVGSRYPIHVKTGGGVDHDVHTRITPLAGMDDVRVWCWTMHQKNDVFKKNFLKEKVRPIKVQRGTPIKVQRGTPIKIEIATDTQLDRGGCSGTLMLKSDVM